MPVFPSVSFNNRFLSLQLFRKFNRKENSSAETEDPSGASSAPYDEDAIVQFFEKKFKLRFSDKNLLITALKHRSFLNVTNEPRISSNERLEFLGDAVLDLIVTHFLYQKFPRKTEGYLSKIKSILVSKPVLADISVEISLGNMVLINWGEEKTGGRQRQSILADAFEAIVGAIYLDMGLEKAKDFVHSYLLKNYQKIVKKGLYRNYKSILLEHVQSEGIGLPEYRVIQELGPDHDKEFVIQVWIQNRLMGEGRGRSKKVAEQRAAQAAIKKLDISENMSN